MRLFSPEAFRAAFLKLMGCTYQEIGSLYDLAPRSVKYHVKAIKQRYPQIEEFFLKEVKEIPQEMTEKIELATALTTKFMQTLRENIQREEQTQNTSQQNTSQIQQSKVPTVLLEAIDRSVSTYYQKEDTSEFETEEDEKVKEEKVQPKKDIWLYIALTFAVFGMIFSLKGRKVEKNEKRIPAERRIGRRIIRLSQMGV